MSKTADQPQAETRGFETEAKVASPDDPLTL